MQIKDYLPDFKRWPAEALFAAVTSMIISAIGTWWTATAANAPDLSSIWWLAIFVGLAFVVLVFFAFGAWVAGLAKRQWHRSPAVAQQPTLRTDAAEKAEEPFVEFTLPGSWAEPGFRHRSLGADGQHELLAEEIHLRIAARQAMQNTRVEISVRHHRPQALEAISTISSSKFVGTVTRGMEQGFQIMQRTYWDIPVTYTDPKTGHQPVSVLRVEKEVFFFPENEGGRFPGQLGHIYYFRVEVHHDEGPDIAEFAIELKAKREMPQSPFRALKNIKPVVIPLTAATSGPNRG